MSKTDPFPLHHITDLHAVSCKIDIQSPLPPQQRPVPGREMMLDHDEDVAVQIAFFENHAFEADVLRIHVTLTVAQYRRLKAIAMAQQKVNGVS